MVFIVGFWVFGYGHVAIPPTPECFHRPKTSSARLREVQADLLCRLGGPLHPLFGRQDEKIEKGPFFFGEKKDWEMKSTQSEILIRWGHQEKQVGTLKK